MEPLEAALQSHIVSNREFFDGLSSQTLRRHGAAGN